MKNILAFSASFASALILFFVAAALCFGLSSGFGREYGAFTAGRDRTPDGTESNSENSSKNAPEKEAIVLAVYFDGESGEMYLCGLDVDPGRGEVTSSPLDCDSKRDGGTLKEIYEKEGVYCLVSEAGRRLGAEDAGFIKFTPATFEKVADRTHGLVYNDPDGRGVLLTGAQARERLNGENFALFCRQMIEYALENDAEKEFLFAVNLCENDLSYPKLYRMLHE